MKPPSVDEENIVDRTISETSSRSSSVPSKQDKSESVIFDIEKAAIAPINDSQIAVNSDLSTTGNTNFSEDIEDGGVIGIITLEDVFEELLQEEIVDETDEYVVVHKRIWVAAAAAASLVARALSIRKLNALKGAGKVGKGRQHGR